MFDPEVELHDTLWDVVGASGGDAALLTEVLGGISKGHVIDVFRQYVLARTELVDRLNVAGRAQGASEDALDDFADAIVSAGRDVYLRIYRGEEAVPDKRKWHKMRGLIHVFGDVFFDMFDEDIYEYLDD